MMMECQSCPTWFVVCHITLLIEFKSDGGFCMLLYRSLVCLVSPPCAICWCDSRALIWLSFICWCSWWRRRQGAVLCHVTRSYQTEDDICRRFLRNITRRLQNHLCFLLFIHWCRSTCLNWCSIGNSIRHTSYQTNRLCRVRVERCQYHIEQLRKLSL